MTSRLRRTRVPPTGAVGGGPSFWSTLYASAVDGDAISVGDGINPVNVIFDMTTTPNYGVVTLTNNATLTVSRALSTQLNCSGMVRMSGSTYFAGNAISPFPNTLTHTVNVTGARANEANNIVPASVPSGVGGGTNLTNPANAIPTQNRAITGMPGSIRYWMAQVPAINIVKLGATANVGATSLTLASAVTWKAGTVIEIGTTKYNSENPSINLNNYEEDITSNYGTERATVAADVNNSTTVTLTAGLTYKHWGQLQYLTAKSRAGVQLEDITGTNLSLVDHGILGGDVFGSALGGDITGSAVLACLAGLSTEVGAGGTRGRVLDNRSTVGVLSCPIRLTCPDDNDWWTHGYGATDMVMGNASIDQLQGVEVFRCGKAGQLGAYPLHHHMRSYTPWGLAGSGTSLGNVDNTKNFAQQCSVHESSNRAFTIHGTNGYLLQKNVFANIDTHAIFLEDGSEINNVIDGNYVVGVNRLNFQIRKNSAAHGVSPQLKNVIKQHDRVLTAADAAQLNATWDTRDCSVSTQLGSQGPSGIWFSHPTNHLRNNIVIGAYTGIWNNFQRYIFGFSKDATLPGIPFHTTTLEHNNNEAGCCVHKCMTTNPHVYNENGDLVAGPGSASAEPILGTENQYQYGSTPTGSTPAYANREFFTNMNFWKSDYAWYGNEAYSPQYEGWHVAGLRGQGYFQNMIHNDRYGIFGNGVPRFRGFCAWTNTLDDPYPNAPITMMLSYGAGAIEHSNFFAPSPITGIGTTANNRIGTIQVPAGNSEIIFLGGVVHLWDFYLYPIYPPARAFSGICRNTIFAGNSPGVPAMNLPPSWAFAQFGSKFTAIFDPTNPSQNEHETVRGLQGAIKLPPDGSFFNRTGWWTFNSPYMLYGTSGVQTALPSASVDTPTPDMNGVIVPSTYDYYGLEVVKINGSGDRVYSDQGSGLVAAINYTRMQADGRTPVTGGTWNTPKWPAGQAWANMRHAVILHGGFVDISFPTRADVPYSVLNSIDISVTGFSGLNGSPSNAHFFMSMDYNAATPITSCALSGTTIPSVASEALLLASTSNAYWLNVPDNKVWIHVVRQAGVGHDVDFDTLDLLVN